MGELQKKVGVGNLAKLFILAGYGTPAVVEEVRRLMPDSNISADSVRCYRWELRREGFELI